MGRRAASHLVVRTKGRYGYLYRPRRARSPGPLALLAVPAIVLFLCVIAVAAFPGEGGAPAVPGDVDAPVAEAEAARVPADSAPVPPGPVPNPYRQATSPPSAPPPPVQGAAWAVLEAPCRLLLQGHDPHARLPPASLTKIATALVVAEHASLSETVTADIDGGALSMETGSTVMGLRPGQRLSVRDLLYGLLLPSGNDAALALAEYVGRGDVSAFVRLLNQKAASLGLQDTHFANPHGLDDPALYTSAWDIAILGAELLEQPALAEIARARTYQPAWDGPPLENQNLLLYLYPGAIGVKIGFTDAARYTIVGAAERDGRRLVVAVLGSSDLYGDAMALLDWAFQSTAPACG